MPEINKGKRLKIGSILIGLFLLLYIPSLLNWLSKDTVSIDILRIGIIEESVNVEGLLVRDEVLLDPPDSDGKFIPEVSEGERIPAYCRVATISDKASLGLLKELEDINEKIILAQNDRAKKTDFFSEDMAKIDENIGEKVQSIINQSNTNSMENIGQLTLDVDKLIEKKASIAGGESSDTHINSLKQEKNTILQKINLNTSQVISQYSGIVSYVIDGYEQVLTPKALKELTPGIVGDINEKQLQNISGYEEVKAGKPFMKVIKGNNTYIAAVIEQDKAGIFKAGASIKVRLNSIGTMALAVVTDISEKNGGKCMITVRIDRYSEELSSMRKINVDLIKDSYEGLKLPLKCLYSPDSDWKKAKVMLIKANCAVQREVEVMCRDSEYAIIKTPENEIKKTVSLYDTYVLNPVNVREGQIILQ